MLSLALVVAFAGMARASYDSIIDWMDTALNPDLFVAAVAEHRRPHDPVSRRRWGRSWRRSPASRACRWCATRASCSAKTPVMVVAVDVDEPRRRPRGATPVAGDADEMYRRDRGRARG